MGAPTKIEFEEAFTFSAVDDFSQERKADFPAAVMLELENTGAVPLTGFAIQLKAHPNADWFEYVAGAGGVDTELEDINLGFWYKDGPAISDLAVGAKTQYGIKLLAGSSIRFRGTAGAGGAELTVRGVIQNQAV